MTNWTHTSCEALKAISGMVAQRQDSQQNMACAATMDVLRLHARIKFHLRDSGLSTPTSTPTCEKGLDSRARSGESEPQAEITVLCTHFRKFEIELPHVRDVELSHGEGLTQSYVEAKATRHPSRWPSVFSSRVATRGSVLPSASKYHTLYQFTQTDLMFNVDISGWCVSQ